MPSRPELAPHDAVSIGAETNELEDRLHLNNVTLHASDLADIDDPARPITQSLKLNDEPDR